MPEQSDGTVVDRRHSPFCFQTHEVLDVIRANFTGAKLSTALSVYLVLTEAANRKGGAPARSGFRATRKEIAKLAGVSTGTLDRYVSAFEGLGILEVEREKVGEVNLPNRWALSDPPSSTHEARVASPMRPFAGAILAEEEVSLERTPPVSPPVPVRDLNRPVEVAGKKVRDQEWSDSLAILAIFNEVSGSAYSAVTEHRKIIGRLREHPELNVEAHRIVIERAFADPWWDRNPSPSVVYGNAGVFERAVHAVRVAPKPRAATAEEVERL